MNLFSMTYSEAKKALDYCEPEVGVMAGEVAKKVLDQKLTPTQAQAVLVSAWGQILKNGRLTLLGD